MKRALSVFLALVFVIGLLGLFPVYAEEIPDVTDYSYTVTPILSPFAYYLYVQTENPDPTSFRLVDENSEFYGENAYGEIRVPTDYGYSSVKVDAGTYYLAQRLYPDVVYEDESTYRVHGGYIFLASNAFSDGGELVLLQKTRSGSSILSDKFEKTAVRIPCQRLETRDSYLVNTCTTAEMPFFEKLDAVQKRLDEIAVYPRSVFDQDSPNEELPYPFLAGSPYPELVLNEHYSMYETLDSGMLVSQAYPFVLDSAGFPSTMWNIAKKLEPSCTVAWGGVHYLINVTFDGATKTYGGAGVGGYDPLFSGRVQQVFTFQGEEDFGTHGTVEGYYALLRSYEPIAVEDMKPYQDLIVGETFAKTIRSTGGTWIRIAVEGFGYGTSFAYVVPLGTDSTWTLSDAWVDGNYINVYERVDLTASFADHPTADILLHDVTFTDRNGRTWTQDVLYNYDSETDTWRAPYFYSGDFWYSSAWTIPDALILTREEVEAMKLDGSNSLPASGLVYDGKEYPGTPFTLKNVTGVSIPETLVLGLNGKTLLTAEITPADAYAKTAHWESSDPAIVAVSSGLEDGTAWLTGKSEGTAVVTVTTADGCYSASCTVTVKDLCKDGHAWDEGTVTVEPTCYRSGKLVYQCLYCEETKTEYISPLEHSYSETVLPPTCTEQGYTTHTCTRCGYGYMDTYVDALGHAWDDGVVTVQPTETQAGVKTFTCTRCNETKTESIPALNHTHSYTAAVIAPTCTEQGYTTNTCECGDSYKDTYVDALGHDYKDGVCTRCGEKDPNAVPPVVYVDVSEKAWYYDAVQYVTRNGLMNGVGGNRFDPNGGMTRAMLVTVLWRYAGQPMGYENKFTDVNAKSGSWYIDAVAWAAENEIVNGVGNNKFDPNGKITREQMAAILFRYANKSGIDTSKRGNLNSFPDASRTASWAKDAVQWTVAEGIINGSDGKLLPKGNATRAQVATILMRFIENIVKK